MDRTVRPRTDLSLRALDDRADLIFHITSASAWQEAEEAGEYRMATKGRTLEEVGFVHCSFADQVDVIAKHHVRRRAGSRRPRDRSGTVDGEIRYENLEGGAAVFPHIYGPLRPAAVVEIGKFEVDDTGRMSFTR